MAIDVGRARAETPGADQVVHFNNAGAALMPRRVLAAVIGHLEAEARIGGYEAAERAEGAIARTYQAASQMLGCAREEIALTENATRAWDMAFYGIRFGEGDRILASQAEYASNYIAFLQMAKKTGCRVEAVPNDESGEISTRALESMLDKRVKLIALTHVPTNGGLVNPAEAVGRIARSAGVPFLLDACQSVGQMPVAVDAVGCDVLAATGRKYLRGPRGTGILYVRESMMERIEPPFLDLFAAEWTGPDSYRVHGDARRFETWETNVAARIGLGTAIDYALELGLEDIRKRVFALGETLRAELGRIPGITVRDLGRHRCGIVSFTAAGRPAAEIRARLAETGINVSVSPAASTRLDMDARGLDAVVRASVHYYNTEDEVDRLCAALREIV